MGSTDLKIFEFLNTSEMLAIVKQVAQVFEAKAHIQHINNRKIVSLQKDLDTILHIECDNRLWSNARDEDRFILRSCIGQLAPSTRDHVHMLNAEHRDVKFVIQKAVFNHVEEDVVWIERIMQLKGGTSLYHIQELIYDFIASAMMIRDMAAD